MFEIIHHYFHYHYPALPGGEITVAVIFLILGGLFGLYTTTKWGGWFALFLNIAFYTVPLMVEFRVH
jgi:hypothetical protein